MTTGEIRRTWQWTGAGFATRQVVLESTGQTWAGDWSNCDWQLPDAGEPARGELVSLTAEVSDDEGFTSEHVCVVAEVRYPDDDMTIRWSIWAYPDVPGIRTHLLAMGPTKEPSTNGPRIQGGPMDARIDRVAIASLNDHRRLFGYYNETQQRNDTHQQLLKQHVIEHPLMGTEWCNWASAACVENESAGIALVKESHKCVNQNGCITGGFVFDEHDGLSCTGWGLRPGDISPDHFTPGWATWCIAWPGGNFERQLAFKTFDRNRYPLDLARDIYIQANTWGSTPSGEEARLAATQEHVLEELESCADLGIDVLQIDDGWQVPPGNPSWGPGDNGWHPHPESYPQGWANVRKRAADLGVRLGLWAAAMPISLDELQSNHTDGGFCQYKLDFAVLRKRSEIDELMTKVRQFIKWTGHTVRVNWDVTENPARYGYFFAREYGCIYLENRKPERPLSVIYRPHTVLRDLWEIAHYLDLHRFQCSIQNVDRVASEFSDAAKHSHSYATVIALMGIPLFFQQTKYYTDAARDEIRPILAVYKQHREAMYAGIVNPIGDCPDNASWAGFQCHCEDGTSGYLTIFRERCNAEPTQTLKLGWVAGQTLRITNLLSGKSREVKVGDDGNVEFDIPDAPGFLYCRYEIA